MRRVRGAAAAFAVLLVSLAGSSTAPSATEGPLARPTPARPCGAHPRPAVYRHVLWIVMENKAYGDVIGSPVAPYENQLARRCGLATSYYVVAHPSLPNYIAHTSGETHGINDNDPPAAHTLAGASLYSQLRAAGKDWRNYEENAPGNCPKPQATHTQSTTIPLRTTHRSGPTALGGTCRWAASDAATSLARLLAVHCPPSRL
jgi:hypothetical protein